MKEWQTAVQMLIDAAEDRAPMMFAKISLHRAIDRDVARVFNPAHKSPYWAPRKLKRDL